jgi:glyoxylase I family protein
MLNFDTAPMNIVRIHHVSVIVSDTAKALDFYCRVLGLRESAHRPPLAFPGAWLMVGDTEIHLLELPNPDPVMGRPIHGGRDRHIALAVKDLENVRAALTQEGISFTISRSGRQALFCRDPDGNGLEFVATQ